MGSVQNNVKNKVIMYIGTYGVMYEVMHGVIYTVMNN